MPLISDKVLNRESLSLQCGQICSTYLWAGRFESETDENVPEIDLGQCEYPCDDCGALFWGAEKLVKGSTPATCCGARVKVTMTDQGRFKSIDDESVLELYVGCSDKAKEFQRNIRAYNRILSVAFPVCEYKNISKGQHRTLIINGAVSFQAHSFPNIGDNQLPRNHGQLYMVDVSEESIDTRIAQSSINGLDRETVLLLENYLRRRNPLLQQFMFAGEVQRRLEEENSCEGDDGGDVDRVILMVNPRRGGFRDTDRYIMQLDSSTVFGFIAVPIFNNVRTDLSISERCLSYRNFGAAGLRVMTRWLPCSLAQNHRTITTWSSFPGIGRINVQPIFE